jgi:DNA-binding transcriptional LysR family regulator
MRVTLSQLRAFNCTASALSYTRAGEDLGYSESAVYQQVKSLEHSLRLKLFFVRNRRLHLTDAARKLLPLADELLTRAYAFEATAESLYHLQDHRVTLGAGAVTSSFILQRILHDLNERHPGINIDVSVVSNSSIVEAILDGHLQIGVFTLLSGSAQSQLPHVPGISSVPWIRDEWLLVCKPRDEGAWHSGAAGAVRIFYSSSYSWSRPLLSQLVSSLFSHWNEDFDLVPLPNVEVVKGAVIGDLGWAFLPGMSITRELELGLVRRVVPEGIERQLFLLLPKDAPSTARLACYFLLHWLDENERCLAWRGMNRLSEGT